MGRARPAPHSESGKSTTTARRGLRFPFVTETLDTRRGCLPASQAWRGWGAEPPRARCPPLRPGSSFGGNFLSAAPPPSPRKPVRTVGPATRVPGAPGRGGAGLGAWPNGGVACRWRPWGRGLLPAPLSRPAGCAQPLPARPAQAPRRVRVVGRDRARDLAGFAKG